MRQFCAFSNKFGKFMGWWLGKGYFRTFCTFYTISQFHNFQKYLKGSRWKNGWTTLQEVFWQFLDFPDKNSPTTSISLETIIVWNCGASADTSHRYFPEIVGSTERIVTWLRLDWKIYVEFNNEIINYIFIDYKSILTSTLIPATTKVFSDGFSLGVNLKNSLLPLYHLMEYKLSPSRSY